MCVGLAFLAPACCSPTPPPQLHARAGKGLAFVASACVRQLHQRQALASPTPANHPVVLAESSFSRAGFSSVASGLLSPSKPAEASTGIRGTTISVPGNRSEVGFWTVSGVRVQDGFTADRPWRCCPQVKSYLLRLAAHELAVLQDQRRKGAGWLPLTGPSAITPCSAGPLCRLKAH